jgi:SP family facilitated glucose transporter-like MFS transporter 8
MPSEKTALLNKQYQESGTPFFFLTIAISAIGAAIFGWTLGYTSPIMVSNNIKTDSANLLCPHYRINVTTGNSSLVFENGTFVEDVQKEYTKANNKDDLAKLMTANAGKMNCALHMTSNFQYWFGSIVNFGCLVGALAGGSLADKFGKKKIMILMQIIYGAGWVMIWQTPKPEDASDDNHWDVIMVGGVGEPVSPSNQGAIEGMLMTGRVLTGMAVGISCTTIAAYQMEICPTAIRGAIGTIFQIAIVMGLFTSYLVGASISYVTLALLPLIMSGIGLVTSLMLRESPVWLLSKGRDAEAKASLRSFRADASSEELDLMLDGMRTTSDGDEAAKGGLSELFGDPTNRKALFIGIGLMLVQQLSGINAIMFYSGTILQTVASSSAEANTYATGMQGLQVIVTFSSAFFMDRAGRVPILLFAATGMVVSTYVLAYYYIFTDGTAKMLALVAFYGYVFFFGCGMGAIPWSIMGEIFKPEVKGLASSVATGVNWSSSFVITFTVSKMANGFQDMFQSHSADWANDHKHAGMGVVFFVYGSVALIGIVFVKAFIPETKGKTMAQIQAELRGDKMSAFPNIQ